MNKLEVLQEAVLYLISLELYRQYLEKGKGDPETEEVIEELRELQEKLTQSRGDWVE